MESTIGKLSQTEGFGSFEIEPTVIKILNRLYPGEIESLSILPIAGDGSDRRFFRIKLNDKTLVLMWSPPSENAFRLKENIAFSYISSFLASSGIPVPEVYFSDPYNGVFLMEDLGDLTLHRYVIKTPRSRRVVYKKVIKLLVQFHERSSDGVDSRHFIDGDSYSPSFVLEKELEYFRRSFLCSFLEIPASWNSLKDDFFRLSELAGTCETTSCIHRDFQSRNIMIKHGKLRLIDYQAMRYGPCEYDLASLLIDPYVEMPVNERNNLVKLYISQRKSFSPARYEAVSLCRNLQILAAFAFLGTHKKKPFFLTFIPKAWKELRRRRAFIASLGLYRLSYWLDYVEDKIHEKIGFPARKKR